MITEFKLFEKNESPLENMIRKPGQLIHDWFSKTYFIILNIEGQKSSDIVNILQIAYSDYDEKYHKVIPTKIISERNSHYDTIPYYEYFKILYVFDTDLLNVLEKFDVDLSIINYFLKIQKQKDFNL